jgi:2-aminoethylphosphonate-pyruvate transaminase
VILLNPGPVNLSARVRAALAGPDMCHREPEFSRLQDRIRRGLLGVYGLDPARWSAVLMTGSGTAALEAMIVSLVPGSGRLLVIENGVYGERIAGIAGIYGIDHARVTLPWGAAIPIDTVCARLDAEHDLSHVAVVHHETTTGRLNDLAALGDACRARGRTLLVDAVSSFGGEALDFQHWGIGACAATANKCLHGAPGVSFVVAGRAALAAADVPARSLYLDLRGYARAQDAGGTPFTQSVQVFCALAEALDELEDEGGWRARHGRYRDLAQIVRTGLTAQGIRALLAAADSSVVLAAYALPDGIDYATLHDRLKAQGFVIYAGQGGLAQSIFRVSTMGAITAGDMHRFVAAVDAARRGLAPTPA